MTARAALSVLGLTLVAALGPVRSVPAAPLTPSDFLVPQGGPWIVAPGEYYSELRASTFDATSFYDDAGDRVAIGGKWEERSLLSYNQIGWKKRLNLILATPFKSVTSRPDVGASTTSSGLSSILVGARYGLKQGASALALELDWVAPLGYDRRISLLGDGLQTLSVAASLGFPLGSRGFLEGGAGYATRYLSITRAGEGPSKDEWASLIPLSADLGWWVTKSLLVAGRYQGSMNSSHGDLYPETQVHLAGPAVVYRVDGMLDLVAGSWSTASGKNYPHYDQLYVGLAFRQNKLGRLQGFAGGTR